MNSVGASAQSAAFFVSLFPSSYIRLTLRAHVLHGVACDPLKASSAACSLHCVVVVKLKPMCDTDCTERLTNIMRRDRGKRVEIYMN